MNNDDINDYLPSLLNPRSVKKFNGDLTLTQNSVVSHCSLSLKRKNYGKNGLLNAKTNIQKNYPNIEISGNTNGSDLEVPKSKTKESNIYKKAFNLFDYEDLNTVFSRNKENIQSNINTLQSKNYHSPFKTRTTENGSIGLTAIDDLLTVQSNIDSSPLSFSHIEIPNNLKDDDVISVKSSVTDSSATEPNNEPSSVKSESTIIYHNTLEKPVLCISFGVHDCETVEVSGTKINIKKIALSHKENITNIDCDMIESISVSTESEIKSLHKEDLLSPPKKLAVAVNLEVKKIKEADTENSKVLILNTNAIDRLSHVIIQPPNYNLVKRRILDTSKFKISGKRKRDVDNGKTSGNLKQTRIDCFLRQSCKVLKTARTSVGVSVGGTKDVVCNNDEVMSKNLGLAEAVKNDRVGRTAYKTFRNENDGSPKSIRLVQKKQQSPKLQNIKVSSSEAHRSPSKNRNDSASSHSPNKHVDSLQFSLPTKSRSNRNSVSPRPIPHYKIVAGTHFAVDAFSYGDIPNVKHYFLTHFHSDHYSGLKKSFNKFLFCSKITADLCISRLGVNAKCIHILNFDESITVEGVEVTAVEANHCPGAIMLVFTLPNGKTLLHTGDFRASPLMESYPVFWNKDIHTIYLDTTYCNPRYDFPTQDHSLEMALYLLRQKKLALDKVGKKFASVLIVCGTYTIGKEKFFLGMARRVGCSVWACPEKDRVLQIVEGRSFSHTPPHSCQLHVVPMRDLTHEKLRSYLNSLQGAFAEVVAFKPSGWENGKNSTVVKDAVTIHGIPYSEHSSFSEMIRFVKFLKPRQVVPTVDISGGIKSVQKLFPCPLICKEEMFNQSKLTDYYSIQSQQQASAVT